MSKSNSGLFSGTQGLAAFNNLSVPKHMKVIKCTTKRQLHEKINKWADQERKKLPKKKRNSFKVACIVYDESNGEVYYGRNRGIELGKEPKNPLLFMKQSEGGLLPDKSYGKHEYGNCAEFHAINKALNNGANISNLKIMVIEAGKKHKIKKCCKNCTHTFKGIVKYNYSGWTGDNEDE